MIVRIGGDRRSSCPECALACSCQGRQAVREQGEAIRVVAATLGPGSGGPARRREGLARLARRHEHLGGGLHGRLAKVMRAWQAGLFVAVRGKGATDAPWDNLRLERWFRLPKGHERKIHSRGHAGVRIVQEGPPLLLALDAHVGHLEPFTAEDLLPYHDAPEPDDQRRAIARRKGMRKARSPKNGRPSSLT